MYLQLIQNRGNYLRIVDKYYNIQQNIALDTTTRYFIYNKYKK